MKNRLLGFLLVALAAPAGALAQSFWEKKDFQSWSKSDVQRLLTDSPWAKIYTLTEVVIQTLQEDPAVSGRDTNPRINYLAQFWSARPIRQALVRQEQMSDAAAKLPPEQKAALQEREAKFIAAEFPKTVIVEVQYSSSSPALDQDLTRFWQTQTPEQLKLSMYLIAGNHKVPPIDVAIAKGARHEFQLVFPRQVEGQPLIAPDEKHVALQLQHPQVGVVAAKIVYLEFDVRKMTVNGELVY